MVSCSSRAISSTNCDPPSKTLIICITYYKHYDDCRRNVPVDPSATNPHVPEPLLEGHRELSRVLPVTVQLRRVGTSPHLLKKAVIAYLENPSGLTLRNLRKAKMMDKYSKYLEKRGGIPDKKQSIFECMNRTVRKVTQELRLLWKELGMVG